MMLQLLVDPPEVNTSQGATSVAQTGKSGKSPLPEASPFSNTYFVQMIRNYNLPALTVNIISHSWRRGGTRSQYDSSEAGENFVFM